jgi:hypothetical protein
MAAECSNNDKEPLSLFLNHNLMNISNPGPLNVERWKGLEKLSNRSHVRKKDKLCEEFDQYALNRNNSGLMTMIQEIELQRGRILLHTLSIHV